MVRTMKRNSFTGNKFKTKWHCVKSVCICSSSGPYFSAFGLNTERDWSVFFIIWTEYQYHSVFNPNTAKCGPEKLLIRTFFTQAGSFYQIITLAVFNGNCLKKAVKYLFENCNFYQIMKYSIKLWELQWETI